MKKCLSRVLSSALFILLSFLSSSVFSSQMSPDQISALIEAFKQDERGPYQAIRWFCPDGTVLLPQERCPQPGGLQHAVHKEVAKVLAREHGIYLGQILAGTPLEDFLDARDHHSRMKQYQLEKYLQAVDNGWILRRARYYRGAVQAENEEAWGMAFLKSIASSEGFIKSQFFLLRQACKDIPHGSMNERWIEIRALSKNIAEVFPRFSSLRVKLHGQPDKDDVVRVKTFQRQHREQMPPEVSEKVALLITELERAYEPSNIDALARYEKKLPQGSGLDRQIRELIESARREPAQSDDSAKASALQCRAIADLLLGIRVAMVSSLSSSKHLMLLDLSNELESIFLGLVGSWRPENLEELLDKIHFVAKAAAGCGFLELWEWERVQPLLTVSAESGVVTLESLLKSGEYSRRVVEWGTGMVRAVYEPEISLFTQFEPLAAGFIDDRVRSSALLSLGSAAAALSNLTARFTGLSNDVMGIQNASQIRGLNPGFALGELVVLKGASDGVALSGDKIYVFSETPADLKPVAGIATVSEGNLVSHVQLLARNLGIPNAVVTPEHLADLMPFSGLTVFYAVSPRGRVVMKPSEAMTSSEKALVEVRKRKEERITVPTDKIALEQVHLMSLKDIRSSDSGRICGPKAANLGQLKSLFPDRVVDGLVIPFGIFRLHMGELMPESDMSYWEYLQDTFSQGEAEREARKTEADVEANIIKRLERLRAAIQAMQLSGLFQKELTDRFVTEFGKAMGQLPVFIRSDTNMEDLKDFTGAGLNLTVFNVVQQEHILQAVRDVWASPFRERSYRWRQKYLLNPENVYPSILILPAVDVDKSGVLITTGVTSSNPGDTTVAFSRGPGGAVEGQMAESWLLGANGTHLLLSPSREARFTLLPPSGGVEKGYTHFDLPLLSSSELEALRELGQSIGKILPGTPGIQGNGPFDVELGFKEAHIWLFQVRPYVENKRAQSAAYLQALDPEIPKNVRIKLSVERMEG